MSELKDQLEKELTKQADEVTTKAKSLLERIKDCPIEIKPMIATQKVMIEMPVDFDNPNEVFLERGKEVESYEGVGYKDNKLFYAFDDMIDDSEYFLSQSRRIKVSCADLIDKLELQFLDQIEKDSMYPESVVVAVKEQLAAK